GMRRFALDRIECADLHCDAAFVDPGNRCSEFSTCAVEQCQCVADPHPQRLRDVPRRVARKIELVALASIGERRTEEAGRMHGNAGARESDTILAHAIPLFLRRGTDMASQSSSAHLGWKAQPFDLMAVDGRRHSLESVRGRNGVLVMVICNHCPYVKAVVDKIVRDARDLRALEIGSVAIMSNDPADYPEDSFDNMKLFGARHGFEFPYVLDETQDVGRAYGA